LKPRKSNFLLGGATSNSFTLPVVLGGPNQTMVGFQKERQK